VEAPTIEPAPEQLDTGAVTASLNHSQQACMLELVNDCGYDQGFFDYEIDWDRRAVEALLIHRDGADAECGTDDDLIISDIQVLDAMPFVGDSALRSLRDYVIANGCDAPETYAIVEGVPFTEEEALATVSFVNHATATVIDDDTGISAKAAGLIVAYRPFSETNPESGLTVLAAVPMVGPATLERLRDHAIGNGGYTCSNLEGEYSEVSFTAQQAHDVLDMANSAQQEELMVITGIGAIMSARIVMARAAADGFLSVTDLDAIPALGPTLLQTLRDEVSDKWCNKPGAACGCGGTRLPKGVSVLLATAQNHLDDPSTEPMARFFKLLGPVNYQRMTTEVLAQLAARFTEDQPAIHNNAELDATVLEALSEVLNQKRFTKPFDWLPVPVPVPDDQDVALQTAVDGLIIALGDADLATTSLGVSFPELILNAEDYYLDDVTAWRKWARPDLEREDLPKSWVFQGWFLDIWCEVTVSRVTGQVLDAILETE